MGIASSINRENKAVAIPLKMRHAFFNPSSPPLSQLHVFMLSYNSINRQAKQEGYFFFHRLIVESSAGQNSVFACSTTSAL